jgi:hypothetical protein
VTAEEYVRRVNYWLTDLPWSTKRELLAELRAHLAELPAESDLDALGSPEEYARDLRAAAGLERRRGAIAFLRARRPRNLILIVLALTLIGLTIGAVTWIDSYQPLVTGESMANPAKAVEDPAGNGESVVFRQGRPFRLGMSIRNNGSYTVRVLGLAYDYPASLPFSARLLVSGPVYRGGTAVPLSRFHPFDLQPGHERFLLLKGVYAHCRAWPGKGATGITGLPIRYSFLWRRATVDIPLPEQLAIVFRTNDNCR